MESAGRIMNCEMGGIGIALFGEGVPWRDGSLSLAFSRGDVVLVAVAFVRTNCPGGQDATGGVCVADDDVSSFVDLTHPVIVTLWVIGDVCVADVEGVCAVAAAMANTTALPVANN